MTLFDLKLPSLLTSIILTLSLNDRSAASFCLIKNMYECDTRSSTVTFRTIYDSNARSLSIVDGLISDCNRNFRRNSKVVSLYNSMIE